MPNTSFRGPVLINGASPIEGFPAELAARMEYSMYFNDFTMFDTAETTDYPTGAQWSETNFTAGAADVDRVAAKTYQDMSGFLRLNVEGNDQGVVTQKDDSTGANGASHGYFGQDRSATNRETEAFFAARIRMRDVSESAIFIGLAELHASSNVLTADASAVTVSDNHVGFHCVNSDNGALRFTSAGTADTSATPTAGVITVGDDEWVEVAFKIRGANYYEAWVRADGQTPVWNKVASGYNTNDWDQQMLITAGVVGGAANDDLDVDYIAFATRRHTGL